MGDARIAALADLQGLKARKEPALPFIEQAEEQNDRGLQLMRQHPFAHTLELPGEHLATRHALSVPLACLAGKVHDDTAERLAVDQRLPVQMP